MLEIDTRSCLTNWGSQHWVEQGAIHPDQVVGLLAGSLKRLRRANHTEGQHRALGLVSAATPTAHELTNAEAVKGAIDALAAAPQTLI